MFLWQPDYNWFWLRFQHMYVRTCFWVGVLMWRGLAVHIGNVNHPPKKGVSMTSTPKKPRQLQKHIGRDATYKIILYKFLLVMFFKLCRKLNCFTKRQSTIFLSKAWAECFILVKVVVFQREKHYLEDFWLPKWCIMGESPHWVFYMIT